MLLALLLLSGCVPEAKPYTPTESSTPAALPGESAAPTAPVPAPLPGPEGVLMRVEGEEITSEEYYYQLVSIISAYEYYYGEEIDWNGETEGVPTREFLRREAAEAVLRFRAVEQFAAQTGVSLTEEEQDRITSEIAAQVEQAGGEEVYEAALASQHLTAELYRYFFYVPELYHKLLVARYGEGSGLAPTDAEVERYFAENYYTSQHVMVALFNEEGESLSDAEQEAAAARLREAREKALAGEDFTALMAEYSEDEWLEGDSVTFTAAMMPDAYMGGLVGTNEGEISEIFQVEDMLVFLKRLPPDPVYFEEYREELREEYTASLLDAELASVRESLAVEYTEEFDLVDPAEIYETYFGTW